MSLSPPSDTFLLLWSALDTTVYEDNAKPWLSAALERAIADPDVDPNFLWQDETLLMRALSRMRSAMMPRQPDELTGWPTVRADETPVMALLDRGAQPWASLELSSHAKAQARKMAPEGLAVLDQALRVNAWSSALAFLKHPQRPAWDELMNAPFWGENTLCDALETQPYLISLFIQAGLDPNWRDAQGTPLLFHIGRAPFAQWLIEAGADPTSRDGKGNNLLMCRDLRQQQMSAKITESERREWVAVMGLGQVDSRQVFQQGLKGTPAAVRPLFKTERSMREWRWQPPNTDREISLLDVSAMAVITRQEGFNSLSKLMSKKSDTHPSGSQRLMWLAERSTWLAPDKAHPLLSDEEGGRLLDAMDDFLRLEKAWQPLGVKSKEAFHLWFLQAPNPTTKAAVLDRWLTWHEDRPERWETFGSVAGASPNSGPILRVPEIFKDQSALHKAAILGTQVAQEMKRQVGTSLVTARAFDERILAATVQCFEWFHEAGADLNAPPLVDLCELLFQSRLGTAFKAIARQQRTMAQNNENEEQPMAVFRRRHRP